MTSALVAFAPFKLDIREQDLKKEIELRKAELEKLKIEVTLYCSDGLYCNVRRYEVLRFHLVLRLGG